MKSLEIINQKLSDPNWVPKPYSYGNWFIETLIDMGFSWQDDQPPHFLLRSGNIAITVSPYSNVVVIDNVIKGFCFELYCHSSIPQNKTEFDELWNNIKHLI